MGYDFSILTDMCEYPLSHASRERDSRGRLDIGLGSSAKTGRHFYVDHSRLAEPRKAPTDEGRPPNDDSSVRTPTSHSGGWKIARSEALVARGVDRVVRANGRE